MGAPKKYDANIAIRVQELAQYGAPLVPDICELVGMSEKTVRKLYHAELAKGRALANLNVGKRLYELCMEGNATALIFWAKTRMGWKEKQAEQGTDIESLKKGIVSAFNSVGTGGRAYGVLVTPGLMNEDQWQKEAYKYAQGKQEK